jgi:hypothetical protein
VLPCGGGRFDCWAAQQPTTSARAAPKPPQPCASSCSMSSRRHALMLIVLAGCAAPNGPCLLRTPHLGVPRSVFVPRAPRLLLLDRAIWILTCSVNIRLSPASFHYADTLRCCGFDAVTSCKLAVRTASQPLALGCDSRSDLLRPPGSAWLTKGGLKVASLLAHFMLKSVDIHHGISDFHTSTSSVPAIY